MNQEVTQGRRENKGAYFLSIYCSLKNVLVKNQEFI